MENEKSSPTAPLIKWLAISVWSILLIGGGGAILNGCVVKPLRTGVMVFRQKEPNPEDGFFAITYRVVSESRHSRKSEPLMFWFLVGGSGLLSLALLWPGIANLVGGFMRAPGLALGYIPDHPGLHSEECVCPHCEDSIIYDSQCCGTEIECPHCGEGLLLPAELPRVGPEEMGDGQSSGFRPILIAPAAISVACVFALWWPDAYYWFIGFAAIITGVAFEFDWRCQRSRGRFVPGKVVDHKRQWIGDGYNWRAVIEYVDGDRTATFLSSVGYGTNFLGFSIKPPLPRIGKYVDVLMVDGEPSSERLKPTIRVLFVSAFILSGVVFIAQHKMGEAIAQSKKSELSLSASIQTNQIEQREWKADDLPILLAASVENPEDTIAAMTLAALQLWFDQEAAYEETRRRMLEWAFGTQMPQVAERVTKVYSLRPYTVAEHQTNVVSLSNTALFQTGGRPDRWIHMAYGMMVYRTGAFELADDYFVAAVNAIPAGQLQPMVEGVCGYYRAMILFQQGRRDEAKALYRATYASMKPLPSDPQNPLANGATHDDLIVWLTSKEAKALLGE